MTTYRERRLARADRLRGWADGQEAKARAASATAEQISSMIPFGQPILVGHHSEGRHRRDIARIDRNWEKAGEAFNKAESMRSRADNIEAQADGAIYSDDPDAVERLEERIADLEAKRDQIKEHNKAMRKKGACDHAADCDCRSHFPRECACKNHPLPGYVLQNLGGNITRQRQRLEQIKKDQARAAAAEPELEEKGVAVTKRANGWVEVRFAEKPAYEVRQALKDAGFRWGRGCWTGEADKLPEGVAS